jgi:hypothetical protein
MRNPTNVFFAAVALASAIALSGCAQDNLSDAIKSLSADNSTACLDITISTPWGTQKATYARSNSANGSAASDTSGCAFSHGGGGAAPAAAAPVPAAPVPAAPTSPIAPAPVAGKTAAISGAQVNLARAEPVADYAARIAALMAQH